MSNNNLFPFDEEKSGVLRKNFSDANEVLRWWESVGSNTYRYAATNWDSNSSIFLDKNDWFFSNEKTALLKSAMQWDKHHLRVEWKNYDPAHPIMGQHDGAFWMNEPDGWWEIVGLPFGLSNFDFISSDSYEQKNSKLLDSRLSEAEREKAIIEGIFETSGVVEDNDPASIGMRCTHDIDFLDVTKKSIIDVIRDELSENFNHSNVRPQKP